MKSCKQSKKNSEKSKKKQNTLLGLFCNMYRHLLFRVRPVQSMHHIQTSRPYDAQTFPHMRTAKTI